MHNEAEFGIAAHWIYSEKAKKASWKDYIFRIKKGVALKDLQWVNQLRDWQGEIGRDDEEFVKGLKIDFFK
ncbi:MAG TPA: hypothetical protein DEA27_03950, partial [Candidatus Moranbacteria bacterium]|nr:hypothetical protein [Candidatus Moranbacteria bacterium]